MITLLEAAQQALKSLRGYRREIGCEQPCDAERALEAALEQPEQEPVAWMSPASDSMIGKTDENGSAYHIITTSKKTANNAVPIYTHPPRREWRGLKEWEINDGLDQLPTEDVCSWSFRKGVYFAEAALKEKNT
jgi:hypothetical protein